MKASWWKYALIALVSLGVIACGKDNSAGNNLVGSASNPIYNGGVQNPTPVSNITDFRTRIANGSFQSLHANGNTYGYWDLTQNQSNNNNCEEIWGFIQWCNYSTGGNYGYAKFTRSAHPDGRFSHERGNSQVTLQFLNSVASSGNYQALQKYYGAYYPAYSGAATTAYAFKTSEGMFVIDFAYPLVANPVVFQPSSSSSTGYFLGAQGNYYQF